MLKIVDLFRYLTKKHLHMHKPNQLYDVWPLQKCAYQIINNLREQQRDRERKKGKEQLHRFICCLQMKFDYRLCRQIECGWIPFIVV